MKSNQIKILDEIFQKWVLFIVSAGEVTFIFDSIKKKKKKGKKKKNEKDWHNFNNNIKKSKSSNS